MRVLMFLIKLNYLRQKSYPVSYYGSIIFTLLFYSIQLVFIKQIVQFRSEGGAEGYDELYLIYFLFCMLYLMVEFFANSINHFFNKVYEGSIEPSLVKPFSVLTVIFFRWCTPASLLIALALSLPILLFSGLLNIEASALNWYCFALSVVLVVICNLCFIFSFNCLTFVFNRKLPVDYIHDKAFDLSIIPVGLLPNSVARWLVLTFPLVLSASLPVAILVGSHLHFLIYLCVSTMVFLVITATLYRKTVVRFNSLGG